METFVVQCISTLVEPGVPSAPAHRSRGTSVGGAFATSFHTRMCSIVSNVLFHLIYCGTNGSFEDRSTVPGPGFVLAQL